MKKETEVKNEKKRSGGGALALLGLATGAALALYLKNRQDDGEANEIDDILADKLRTVISNGETDYAVVFDRARDAGDPADDKTGDIEARLAKRLSAALKESAGADFSVISTNARDNADVSEFCEILIGATEREESKLFRESLEFNEYGFNVRGSKIVVSGTNRTSTEKAVDLFADYVKGAVKDGELILPDGIRITDKADEWHVDIPEFEGGAFKGTHDCDLGALMLYYTDATPEGFEDYLKKLESAGYKLWQRNDIGENLHAGYMSDKGFVYAYYIAHDATVRIVTSKTCALPGTLAPEKGKKLAKPLLVQLACDYTRGNYGMGYIVRLEDSTFVVIDGGDNGEEANFSEKLLAKLKKLNKRPDGRIIIRGWFISHIHIDHYAAFADLCRRFGSEVEICQLLMNTPSKNYGCNLGNPDRKLQKQLDELQAGLSKPMDVVKVHAGMRFYLGGAEFEILHTHEDIYPAMPKRFNDTSIVWRMRYKGQSVLWLADITDFGSKAMVKRYRDYLKSDFVQVAHHGYDGATVSLYTHAAAPVVLWPNHKKRLEHVMNIAYKRYAENKYIETVAKEVYVAETDAAFTLPYKAKKRKNKYIY